MANRFDLFEVSKIASIFEFARVVADSIFHSLCIGILLAIVDITVMSTALYTVALDLGSLNDAYWVILAYNLTELGR